MTDTSNEALDAMLERGRKALEGVTPGPWAVGPVDDTMVEDASGLEVAAIDGDYNSTDTWPIMESNARFIAASRDLVPELLDTITALRAERDAMAADIASLTASLAAEVNGRERDVQAAEAAALERAEKVIDCAGDGVVTKALGQQLCCSGHMCGCQGADVRSFLQYLIREEITPDATTALDAVRADARRAGVVEGLLEAAKLYEDGGGPGVGGWDYFGDFHDAILARAEQIERGEG